MKSIKEKAQRYDKALKEAVIAHKDEDRHLKATIERIFPELKESEDERIRKNIIATIHLYYGEPLDDEAKEMIALLEKQGEQKPAWSEEDEKKLNYLIALLQNSTMTNVALSATNEGIEDFLKSLKNRYTWKPSSEQIEAIRLARSFVVDDFDENPTLSEILLELEKQLKEI